MEIALLFLAALALIIGYQFYQKHKAFWSKEEAVIDFKEEVVAEVAVEEVEKAATPKVKAAKKKVAEVEEKIETAVKKTPKKPKIKIAK